MKAKAKAKKGHHECGARLEYKNICGIRLYKVDDQGKGIYEARCPDCMVTLEVAE